MSELKPCQFCGKPGTIWESRKLVPGYHDASRSVGCKACGYTLASRSETTTWFDSGRVTTNTEEVDGYLASIWNRRVSPWRSLKDDPPISVGGMEQLHRAIVVRDTSAPSWTNRYVMLLPKFFDAELLGNLKGSFTEWMEIPT